MFKELKIHDFRLFEDKDIILGRNLTVLAGRNATGKSTILGMLGNSSELKKKTCSTYFGGAFRAEYSELFKGSKDFDVTGSDRFEIIISDDAGNEIEQCSFRTAWQKHKGATQANRFRIIPKRMTPDGKKTEAKMEYPVQYLGLSRLFPIGEAQNDSIARRTISFICDEHRRWFLEKHNNILSSHDNVVDVSSISIGETDKKSCVGITTEKYDYLTNSSGQDNLGQILFAVLSFKQLKERMGSDWKGGLLLIDEIEASLHPAAQIRLIELLKNESRHVGFQVVFTTHSLSILREICQKVEHNNPNEINFIELYYFTNANRRLEASRNISYSEVENDLLIQSAVQNNHKIRVYTEDEEARWILRHVLSNYLQYIDMLDVHIGCDDLMSLYKSDIRYFGNSLILLDGDVKQETIDTIPLAVRDINRNIEKLPGGKRPEDIIYDYLHGLPPDHSFWAAAKPVGFTWDYFNDNGPNSSRYSQKKDRERCKAWLMDHASLFDQCHVMDYWIEDNKATTDDFIARFVNAFNAIAERTLTPKIQIIAN